MEKEMSVGQFQNGERNTEVRVRMRSLNVKGKKNQTIRMTEMYINTVK